MKPDYEFWDQFDEYSLTDAAYLCADLKPENTDVLPREVAAWRKRLEGFIESNAIPSRNTSKLHLFNDRAGRERKISVPGETRIRRDDLRFFFEQTQYRPPFLFPPYPSETTELERKPDDETPEQRRERLKARKAELKAQGVRNFNVVLASEEGVSFSRIKDLTKTG